ncbi:MAG: MBG domain-containing protein [Nocardioides sp.]
MNGDRPADIAGLLFHGASPDAAVGTYPITVSGGTDDNYEYRYRQGKETVTATP